MSDRIIPALLIRRRLNRTKFLRIEVDQIPVKEQPPGDS